MQSAYFEDNIKNRMMLTESRDHSYYQRLNQTISLIVKNKDTCFNGA
jgi:hypothetical protein